MEEANSKEKKNVLELSYDGNPAPVMEHSFCDAQNHQYTLRYDFNCGLRLQMPHKIDKTDWHVIVSDNNTTTILFSNKVPSGGGICTPHKYYIDFHVEIYDCEDDAKQSMNRLATIDYNADGKNVMFLLDVYTIGDTLAWFPYIEKFVQKHECNGHVVMSKKMKELLENQYLDIDFLDREKLPDNMSQSLQLYATYKIGIWWNDDFYHTPADHRLVGLAQSVGMLLGVEPFFSRPRLPIDLKGYDGIEGKYVCIAVQSTTQAKNWLCPNGWYEVVKFLRSRGYKVVCIDKEAVYGTGMAWQVIPWGVEDMTGDLPLEERVRLLRNASFFVGLASGLSWLAWACGLPVVLISGFSDPKTEFYTKYRVINRLVCHSCWNDPRYQFDHHDFEWCPRHKGTARQWECSRQIHPKMVIDEIKRLIIDENLE